jgi:hypothetical protein
MVELKEVTDEEYLKNQQQPTVDDEEEEWDTDDGIPPSPSPSNQA